VPELGPLALTWPSMGSLVFVDEAAEDLPSPSWQVQRRTGLVVLIGRSLLAGLVRPVPVVMVGVLAENRSKVAFVVKQPSGRCTRLVLCVSIFRRNSSREASVAGSLLSLRLRR
jgi:hypothetical protein